MYETGSCICCRGNVEVVLGQKDQRGALATLLKDLDLEQVLNRDVEHLSGEHISRAYVCEKRICF